MEAFRKATNTKSIGTSYINLPKNVLKELNLTGNELYKIASDKTNQQIIIKKVNIE